MHTLPVSLICTADTDETQLSSTDHNTSHRVISHIHNGFMLSALLQDTVFIPWWWAVSLQYRNNFNNIWKCLSTLYLHRKHK